MSLHLNEAAAFLRRLDVGDEQASVGDGKTWDNTFAGDHEWTFESGWKLVVFNDCDEWDYVDSIIAPDGRVAKFDDWHKDLDVRDEHGGWVGYSENDDADFIRNYEPTPSAKIALRMTP